MIQEKKYVLMLVSIDDERKDLAGNYYPEKGFINNKNFDFDLNLMSGFYGIKWGKIKSLSYEKRNKNWVVVKIEDNKKLICLDKYKNKYKFKEGLIVCSGDISSCLEYIKNKEEYQK